MAGGLSPRRGTGPRFSRRVAWGALVLGVIGMHACVTESVATRMAAVADDARLPARMEVAYVRDMALSAPPATAAAAAPTDGTKAATSPKPVRRRAARPKPPRAASEPAPGASAPDVTVANAAQDEAPAPSASAVVAAAPASSEASSPAAPQAAASAASAPSSPATAFQWPVSTKVTYLLTGHYRGPVSGTAEVEWVRVGSHYQVHVDFLIGPSLAPLITQNSSSDGEIGVLGLAPRRYDQDMTVFGSARPRQTVLFDDGNVILANGDVREETPGMQDTASQFVQLTYLFSTRPDLLRVGGSVQFPLALPRKVDLYTYDVVGQEELATPFGALQGIHLKPRNPRSPGSIGVEMWFAPQLQYFPARLHFEQDEGSYVDLMISRPPQMAQ